MPTQWAYIFTHTHIHWDRENVICDGLMDFASELLLTCHERKVIINLSQIAAV